MENPSIMQGYPHFGKPLASLDFLGWISFFLGISCLAFPPQKWKESQSKPRERTSQNTARNPSSKPDPNWRETKEHLRKKQENSEGNVRKSVRSKGRRKSQDTDKNQRNQQEKNGPFWEIRFSQKLWGVNQALRRPVFRNFFKNPVPRFDQVCPDLAGQMGESWNTFSRKHTAV